MIRLSPTADTASGAASSLGSLTPGHTGGSGKNQNSLLHVALHTRRNEL